ncbi:hypothetical protein M8818_005447 [Zalaria obscura]|uniref:Uncharacterized protein n=1 Tax=Zalaria obscura TaxID=2024903 RepID=A0ACC3S8I6_9PEZI
MVLLPPARSNCTEATVMPSLGLRNNFVALFGHVGQEKAQSAVLAHKNWRPRFGRARVSVWNRASSKGPKPSLPPSAFENVAGLYPSNPKQFLLQQFPPDKNQQFGVAPPLSNAGPCYIEACPTAGLAY